MEDGDGGFSGLMAWARSRAPGIPQDRAQARAASLEPGEYEGTAKHPFPVADREKYLEAVRTKGIAKRTLTAPVGRVRLDAIQGIQRTINRERLSQHLANARLIPDGTRAPGHGALIDLPIIVKMGGELFVHDGHHRLSAAHLRGEATARVRLVDLDAP